MRKKWKYPVMVVLLVLYVIYVLCGLYNRLQITYDTIESKKLPEAFSGYKIVFISDFHCKKEGNQEQDLIKAIESCKPDLVVFTGDMIDGDHLDISAVKQLLEGLKGKYPMYAIDGNHERDIPDNFKLLLAYYKEYGVTYLDDSSDFITKGSETIGIYGRNFRDSVYSTELLKAPDKTKADYNILLYHDSLAFTYTSLIGFDLILSGHTHGGIVRLPFVGGVFSNTGGLFPKYDGGVYHYADSTMVSSRGIGDSLVPRFYNRSEVICVTLQKKE